MTFIQKNVIFILVELENDRRGLSKSAKMDALAHMSLIAEFLSISRSYSVSKIVIIPEKKYVSATPLKFWQFWDF